MLFPQSNTATLSQVEKLKQSAGWRVLIVEDDPLIALGYETFLRNVGVEPLGPAGSVEQALRLIDRAKPDAAQALANAVRWMLRQKKPGRAP